MGKERGSFVCWMPLNNSYEQVLAILEVFRKKNCCIAMMGWLGQAGRLGVFINI